MRNEKFEERMTAGQVAQHRRHGRLDDDMSKQKVTHNLMNLGHIRTHIHGRCVRIHYVDCLAWESAHFRKILAKSQSLCASLGVQIGLPGPGS